MKLGLSVYFNAGVISIVIFSNWALANPATPNAPKKSNAAPATVSSSAAKRPPVTPTVTKSPAKVSTPPAKTGVANRPASIAKISSAKATGSTAPTGTSTTQKPIALQGYLKHHHHKKKHEFESLLKKEFDSPIHAVETDNKDF